MYNFRNPFMAHNHTEKSNFRLKDAINKVDKMIDYAHEIGLSGIAITDHECLSAHVEAIDYVQKQKATGKLPEEFRLALGNEIYLVDREDTLTKKENNDRITFYHFLLLAKDKHGYQALKELTSRAWNNSFFFRGMERVPTYKDDFEQVLRQYKGHVIASTACLGSEFSRNVVAYATGNQEAKARIHQLLTWLISIFGDDLYVELQPSEISEEQIIYNKMAKKIAKAYGLKPILTTDAHYLNKDQAKVHEIYLKSNDGEREVAEFYSTTYLMGYDEARDYFPYFTDEEFDELMYNTLEIRSKIEEYDLKMETQIPKVKIPEFELSNIFHMWYDKYDFIRRYANSNSIEDRYFLYLVEQGFINKKQEFNEENIARINTEIEELWEISINLNQPLSAYYILVEDIIDIMWTVSLVGVSRGSSSGFYTCYLMDIVQMNPIKYNLPHWRHISKERPELPDIDIDTEGAQRQKILELIKEKYGDENVLNICTFTTEKTKSAVLSACRGLDIDNDLAQGIASLIPAERGQLWPFKDVWYGNEEKGRKPVKAFIDEVEKYEGLRETIEGIEGLVSGRSQHASGIYVFPNGYVEQNAMMKTTKGYPVTQFNMKDSDAMGGLKLDALTINALDRIRKCLDLLIEHGKAEWQGSLRATYNKYLHPDVMELENPEMFKLLYQGDVINAFQFETNVGKQALTKIKPNNFFEIATANSLMRLAADHGESPLDKYARFKFDLGEWFKEMQQNNITEDEMEVLKNHLLSTYGICDTQEVMMEISMDPIISNFSLVQANKLRKGIAKKSPAIIEECREMFYGNNPNARIELLDYVWEYLFKPSFGYSFSKNHTAPYSMILMQEMNMAYRYGIIWWKTACLSVNAGVVGDEGTTTDYGAVAKAVGEMKGVVINPDINTAKLEFTPIEAEDKVMFGLKPISGLGNNAIQAILENRPFTSLDDFIERMVHTKLVSDAKTVTLLKAGCFDRICGVTKPQDRRNLMVELVRKLVPAREKITMVQLPKLVHAVPETYAEEMRLYEMRNKLFGRNKVPMTKELEKEILSGGFLKQVEYEFVGDKLTIDQKSFDKFYKKSIERLKEWVTAPEALAEFNRELMREFWKKYCMGSVEQWEMETLVFYSNYHELDYYPLDRLFEIADFEQLPEDPVVTGYNNWKGRQWPKFQTSVIAGVVVDKNKTKGLVSVLTQTGVVTVRYNKGAFINYDKKVVEVDGKTKNVLDESWFNRGTKLVLTGFRRGEEFVLRTYNKTAPYNHTTIKVNGYNGQEFDLQFTKKKA